VFYAGNAVVRFRVSEKAEIAGLNISELGLQHESELQSPVSLSRETSG
jgi:Amt family ammonium transporter